MIRIYTAPSCASCRKVKAWLKEHDYIGVKIATKRATVEEYANEIAEMTEKAERINEIDRLLESL